MKKGEIWLVELPSTNGHEQIGTRPVIVLAETANIAVIIPFTSNAQALRFPHTFEVKSSKKNGLSSISIAMIFQIRAIDKKRLKKQLGILEDSILKEIDIILKKMINL